jgi:hypothetical protein
MSVTPISVILAPKLSESLPLSSFAFINTYFFCILLIDCICFVLGNVVPEPFSEDFHDQAFEESQVFFVDQQGKLP